MVNLKAIKNGRSSYKKLDDGLCTSTIGTHKGVNYVKE